MILGARQIGLCEQLRRTVLSPRLAGAVARGQSQTHHTHLIIIHPDALTLPKHTTTLPPVPPAVLLPFFLSSPHTHCETTADAVIQPEDQLAFKHPAQPNLLCPPSRLVPAPRDAQGMPIER